MSAINGTWILVESENWDELLKDLGIGLIQRKAMRVVKPTFTFSNNGTKWLIKMRSTFINKDIEFTLGQEFEDEGMDGKKHKCLSYLNGDKLVFEQRDRKTNQLQLTIVRSVGHDDKLVEKFTSTNVSAKHVYRRA